MAKSKAQRMREYRERKKHQLGDKEWLRRERARTKSNFKPMSELDERSKEERRAQNRKSQERFRRKRKQQEESTETNQTDTAEIEAPSTSVQTNESEVTSTTDSALVIKMPFPSRVKKGKKRASRALSKAYRRVETLEDQNEELRKKLRNAQKRLQRYEEKKKQTNTPRGKADSVLKQSGIDPKSVPEVRKKLIYNKCLNEEIKEAKDEQLNKSNRQQVVHKVASGRVMKKYRMKSTLEQHTQLNRKKSYASKSVLISKRSRLASIRNRVKDEVIKFLERDDNSRVMPGKADAVKGESGKVQRRVLNDYLYNLHQKFLSETTVRIKQSAFYKCRPPYISPVNFASRNVCLCSRHQNFCFILRALKAQNITTCTNPDKFVEQYKDNTQSLQEMLEKLPRNDENIKYQQWKRVKLKNGKERQRVIELEKRRAEFISMVIEEFNEFKGYVKRVNEQYLAVKLMKEKLPKGHILIQMDFSENYTCATLEEIQSAYWNSCMITLHPVVLYTKSNDDEPLKHMSYVYVSEVLNHNAAMVITIINKLVKTVKDIVPDLEQVHFWTDSPSSQYRNKTIFDIVSNFEQRFGVKASWHYFEAGHGKGPCDGVGGTTKRNADNAVKQGRVLIQDAQDFFDWAKKEEKGIRYELVTEEEYNNTKKEVDDRNARIKAIKGSMMLHAVVGEGEGHLVTRNTSCACDECFINGFNKRSKCGWNPATIIDRNVQATEQSNETEAEQEMDQEVDYHQDANAEIKEDDFVIARYENKKYIGDIYIYMIPITLTS